MAKYRFSEMYEVRDTYEVNIDAAQFAAWKAQEGYTNNADEYGVLIEYIRDVLFDTDSCKLVSDKEQVSDTDFDLEGMQ